MHTAGSPPVRALPPGDSAEAITFKDKDTAYFCWDGLECCTCGAGIVRKKTSGAPDNAAMDR